MYLSHVGGREDETPCIYKPDTRQWWVMIFITLPFITVAIISSSFPLDKRSAHTC